MDEREISERIQYFGNIAAKYGYSTVPASVVYQAFERIARLERKGFTPIKTGLYGRVINEDIVHLIKLQPLKGRDYTVWWGVSLSFIPYKWDTRLRWRRTFKSSRFALFETPFDYFSLGTANWRERERFVANTLHGEEYFKRTLEELWRRLEGEIDSWFGSTESLSGVLEKAREQVERKWIGPSHHPNPLMVYAFTLARLGYIEEAHIAIEKYFQLGFETSKAQENLMKALEKISGG